MKKWGPETDVHVLYPKATAVTWWIMLYTENNEDQKLYNKLADCAKYFHPYAWTAETCQTMAYGFLRSTANQMSKESAQEMHGQFVAFDAFAAGAGPIAGCLAGTTSSNEVKALMQPV